MKILKIAAPKSLMQYVSKQWPVVELASTLKGAELAAMVVSAESEDEMRLATAVQAKSMLDIPVVKVDITQPAVDITREIDAAALQYEKKMVKNYQYGNSRCDAACGMRFTDSIYGFGFFFGGIGREFRGNRSCRYGGTGKHYLSA